MSPSGLAFALAGGCPDVPFLAASMVGRTLSDAPHPRDIGHTLCGYPKRSDTCWKVLWPGWPRYDT